MWQESDADTPVIRYLLGELSPEACEAYEDRYLSDETLHEELLAAEDELVDAYLRDELSPEQRTHFEQWFLRTPARQEQLKFAQALMRFGTEAMDASSSAVPGCANSSYPVLERASRSLWSLLKSHQPALQLAFALIVVAAILLPWALRITRPQPDVTRSSQVATSQVPPQSRATSPGEVTPPSQVPPPKDQPRRRSDTGVVSVVIMPVERRSSEEQVVHITPDARTIHLQLPLTSDDYESYRVTLESVEAGRTRTFSGLRSHTHAAGGRALTASFSSNDLRPGEYVLQVEGARDSSHFEPVGGYAFRVALDASSSPARPR